MRTPTEKEIEVVAAAIANARIMRRGSPPISNVLEALPSLVREQVLEEAKDALVAVFELEGSAR